MDFARDLKREGAKTILDLGCGAGRHSILLAKQGFRVVALDISETALNVLNDRLRAASVTSVALVKHEMLDLPFIDGYFDGIICTNVLHHGKLAEIKRAVRETRRVMRKGASAFIVALSEKDFRKGNGKKLEPNTYVFTEGDERGIIHHFFPRSQLLSCLRGMRIVSFRERLIPIQEGGNRAHFLVKMTKP